MATFNNGESGLSVRTKINEAIDKVDGNSAFDNDIEVNGNVSLGDNDELRFGDSDDLVIKYNGTNGTVTNDAGHLYLTNTANDNDVVIQSDDGSGGVADYFRADGSTGQAKLFSYGAQKLTTHSWGAEVTGALSVSGSASIVSSNPYIFLTDTDTGADHKIHANSGVGNLMLEADINGEGSDPKILLRVSGDAGLAVRNTGQVDIASGVVELSNMHLNGLQVTIASDAFATITPTGRYGGFLSVVCAGETTTPQMGLSGYALVDFGATPSSPAGTQTTGSDFDVYTSGPPTGTTGTDSNVGLFLGGTSGSFYIENRRSSSSNFQITLL